MSLRYLFGNKSHMWDRWILLHIYLLEPQKWSSCPCLQVSYCLGAITHEITDNFRCWYAFTNSVTHSFVSPLLLDYHYPSIILTISAWVSFYSFLGHCIDCPFANGQRCLSQWQVFPPENPLCGQPASPFQQYKFHQMVVQCCRSEDFCNLHLVSAISSSHLGEFPWGQHQAEQLLPLLLGMCSCALLDPLHRVINHRSEIASSESLENSRNPSISPQKYLCFHHCLWVLSFYSIQPNFR